MLWILGGLLVLAALSFFALQVAIARNGPAVLDTVDRITATARNIERLPTTSFGDHPAQKLVVVRPENAGSGDNLPVLVFQHGGSWKDGDPEDYGFVGRSFAPHGFVAVIAGYRLGEDGVFPAMLEDGADGLAWIRENIGDLGGDPDNIILMGHSAGAYNVAMLALDRQWLADAQVPHSAIKGVVGLAGPFDFYPFDSDSTRATFGGHSDPQATQPVNFVADHAPPFLLIHGELDTTVRIRNSKALANRLEEYGVVIDLLSFSDMDHTAPLLRIASPWRDKAPIHDAIRRFASNPKTSVSVQGESR